MKLNNIKRPLHMLLLATMLGGFSTYVAAAPVASQTMKWSGEVPGASATNFIIKGADALDIKGGNLTFDVGADGKGVLSSSTPIAFNVYNYTAGVVGAAAGNYTYSIDSIKVNGNLISSNSYFSLLADGANVTVGADRTKTGGVPTELTIATSAAVTPTDRPNALETVSIAANVVIKSAAVATPPTT